jgi:serine/threonine protein kinase
MLTESLVTQTAYRLLERIGQGEIGEVYKAERVGTEQLFALKVLNAGLMGDPMLVARFREEAKKASMLRHPNAVRIEGVGEAEDGRPFVAMEYLPGENLREVMARHGRLLPSRACFIARQVATVLQAAHALGFVHQDVTPGNIMLVETPVGTRVRLLDSCIARIKEGRRRDIGRIALGDRGALMGTPEYFSPEMAVGKPGSELEGRSDLYSLGVVLYQMLCGDLPFETKSGAMEALLAHLLIPPKPICGLRPEMPEELRRLVEGMLEKKPELRPASSRIVVEELEKVERLLAQTAARTVASLFEAGDTAELQSSAPTPTLSPDSPSQSAKTLAIQSGTGEPEAPAPRRHLPVASPHAEATQKAPRRWPRWGATTAIAALSLGLAAWFLAPLRQKLAPHVGPGASANGVASGPSSAATRGKTSQGATAPAPQSDTSRAASSSVTTPVVPKASPPPPPSQLGARTSPDEGRVGGQAAPLTKGARKASQAPGRPSPDPATVRALTAEGDEFFRQGEYDRAIQSYGKALRLDPSSEAIQNKILRAKSAKAAEQKYLNE